MTDPEISRFLRDQWREIAELLWPESPGEQFGAEIDRLDAQLALRQARLLRCRKRIENVRNRMDRLSASLLGLPLDSGSSKWLERRRRRLDQLHEKLRSLESAYTRLLARLDRCKQQRAALGKRFLSPPPVEKEGEDNDAGYSF
jgi:hypothetical protein